MTLQQGVPGSAYTVQNLSLPTVLERRLEALGVIEGTTVTVLRKKPKGAMVISVRGSRFAIGFKIAANIEVAGQEA